MSFAPYSVSVDAADDGESSAAANARKNGNLFSDQLDGDELGMPEDDGQGLGYDAPIDQQLESIASLRAVLRSQICTPF